MEPIVEGQIAEARVLVQQLDPADSRRVIANGRLSVAEEHVVEARRAVQEALVEITSPPEEFFPDGDVLGRIQI